MSQPTLYLMIGYPGAGKTTISELIARATGATHLWADKIRRECYGEPLYTQAINDELYAHLNSVTAELLGAGNSVVFDTNFNYRRDRDLLRDIAQQHGAKTLLLWVKTPRATAEHRATIAPPNMQHRVHGIMSLEHFNEIANKLEPPTDDEHPIIINGTDLTTASVGKLLAEHL